MNVSHPVCRYVEQLVASAEAAVNEVIQRGVCMICLRIYARLPVMITLNIILSFKEYSYFLLTLLGGSSRVYSCWWSFLWGVYDS